MHGSRDNSFDGDRNSSSDEEDGSPTNSQGYSNVRQDPGAVSSSRHRAHAVSHHPLHWVSSDGFKAFIGVCIAANAAVLWGETDDPDYFLWKVCEHTFIVIFCCELGLRLCHSPKHFCGKEKWWSIFDSVIVAFGVLEMWIYPLFLNTGEGQSYGSSLRLLRLTRLLRLLRIFKMHRNLSSFVSALAQMVSTMFLIFGVLFIFILCNAIILTHLLGHAEALSAASNGDADMKLYARDLQLIQAHFETVSASIFTLFQVTTVDSWNNIASPIIQLDWRWRLYFVGFILFASWTMISVLTAVASDNLIAATSDRKEQEQREQEMRQREFINFLRATFEEADEDKNGLLDKEEFETMLKEEIIHTRMKELGVSMSQDDLKKAWKTLDIEGGGELTIDEFVTGLSYLQEGLATRHVVNIDYSLKRVAVRLGRQMESLQARIDRLRKHNDLIKDSQKRQAKMTEQVQLSLWYWQEWAIRNDSSAVPEEQLKEISRVRPEALAKTPVVETEPRPIKVFERSLSISPSSTRVFDG